MSSAFSRIVLSASCAALAVGLLGATGAPPGAVAAPAADAARTAVSHAIAGAAQPHVAAVTCTTVHAGLTPCDLRSAYGLTGATGGARQTVAVVGAYDDPKAESDLAVYRRAYRLPACTTANGCFRKVDQNGLRRYPAANAAWAQELSLDLDMVSAVCPHCHILLVEATSKKMMDLLTAENQAAKMGATVISNSWGFAEFRSERKYDSYFRHGIPITASTGDSGYGVWWPASSPYVTAVGGTTLVRSSTAARGWAETAWSGAGSGCSKYEPKPAFQTDTRCKRRTVADVSAVANPKTPVAAYDTYRRSGWLTFGGTSVGAPIIAAVYALAGNGKKISTPGYAYAHRGAFSGTSAGSNGSCGGSYLCAAVLGYDGPTGLGTPKGVGGF
jgi:subtilase family serine protease